MGIKLSGATLEYAESIAEVGQCNAQVQQWGSCTAWFKRVVGVLKDYTPHGDEHAARRDELVAEYQELVKMSDEFAASPFGFSGSLSRRRRNGSRVGADHHTHVLNKR